MGHTAAYREDNDRDHLIRLLLVQTTYAHYRRRLVAELETRPRLLVTYLHDPRGPITRGPSPISAMKFPTSARVLEREVLKLGPFAYHRSLIRAVNEQSFDAVLVTGDAHNLSYWVLLLAARLRLVQPRVFLWTHGWSRPDGRLTALVKRAFFTLASGLLLYSERARAIGLEEGYPAERLHVIGNSLDLDDGSERRRQGIKPRPSETLPYLQIICVARLTHDREMEELFWAMNALRTMGVSPTLTLVGEGEALPGLRRLALSLGVDVRFLGAIYDPEELSRLYANSDVCVIPGRAGLTVAQALAYGVPVVAHGEHDRQMPEVSAIDGATTGMLYRRGDPNDLARKVLHVVNQRRRGRYSDEECRSAFMREFSARRHAELIELAIARGISDHVMSRSKRDDTWHYRGRQ